MSKLLSSKARRSRKYAGRDGRTIREIAAQLAVKKSAIGNAAQKSGHGSASEATSSPESKRQKLRK